MDAVLRGRPAAADAWAWGGRRAAQGRGAKKQAIDDCSR